MYLSCHEVNYWVSGFSIGSLVGGILYKKYGGVTTMRIYATLAAVTAIAYFISHVTFLKYAMPETGKQLTHVNHF